MLHIAFGLVEECVLQVVGPYLWVEVGEEVEERVAQRTEHNGFALGVHQRGQSCPSATPMEGVVQGSRQLQQGAMLGETGSEVDEPSLLETGGW